MSDPLFYFFAALTFTAAVLVVSCRNPVNSAVSMITALVGIAAIFFLLNAPFLGVLQVLIYAGAVMVLFLFVIMLLDIGRETARSFSWWRILSGAGVFVVCGGALVWLVNAPGNLPEPDTASVVLAHAGPEAPLAYASGAKAFGELLFSKYMLPVQAAGFLLLAAMVGVVSLAARRKR